MPMSSPPPQELGKLDEEVANEEGEGPEGPAGGGAEGEGEGREEQANQTKSSE